MIQAPFGGGAKPRFQASEKEYKALFYLQNAQASTLLLHGVPKALLGQDPLRDARLPKSP